MDMIPVYGFGGMAVVWVLIYWRVLVLRKRVLDALRQGNPVAYTDVRRPIDSAPLMDRLFATSEVIRAQVKHEAVLLGKELPRDVSVAPLQSTYRRWIGFLAAWTFVYIASMLLVAWILSR